MLAATGSCCRLVSSAASSTTRESVSVRAIAAAACNDTGKDAARDAEAVLDQAMEANGLLIIIL